jgi:hypothetical protein
MGGFEETSETVQEAVNWRHKNYKYTVNIAEVVPYPGTDLYKKCVENKLIDPSSFISHGCPPVKMCNASMQFPTEFCWGEVISSEKTGNSSFRGDLYKITAKCPHCQQHVTYNNIYWGAVAICFTRGASYRIGCKNCNQRFDIQKSAFSMYNRGRVQL